MSLYLKYRPRSFSELVGQETIVQVLQSQLESGKNHSSYLFFGPRGTGKTSTSRIFAKALNYGHDKLTDEQIDELIDSGSSVDYVEIDAASHTGVDNIREEIIEKAMYTPTVLRKKVYVIDEVHMLSKAAFNALLKTIEEPPAYLVFILATTEFHKVPETIISRCQCFQFTNHTTENIHNRLRYIAQQESIPVTDAGISMITTLAEGALRDGIKYLEQVSILGEVNEKNVSQFLGSVSDETLRLFIDHIKSGNFENIEKHLIEMYEQGADLGQLIKNLMKYSDRSFTEDPSFYAGLGQALIDIYGGLRVTPHSLIVIKSGLWKFLHPTQTSVAPSAGGKLIQHTTSHLTQPVASIQSVSSPQQKSSQTLSSAPEEKTSPVSLSQQQASHEKTPTSAPLHQSGGFDLKEMKAFLLSKVEKKMLSMTLGKYTELVGVEDGCLKLVCIHEQFIKNIEKIESQSRMIEILSEKYPGVTKVRCEFMSKLDFAKSLLS